MLSSHSDDKLSLDHAEFILPNQYNESTISDILSGFLIEQTDKLKIEFRKYYTLVTNAELKASIHIYPPTKKAECQGLKLKNYYKDNNSNAIAIIPTVDTESGKVSLHIVDYHSGEKIYTDFDSASSSFSEKFSGVIASLFSKKDDSAKDRLTRFTDFIIEMIKTHGGLQNEPDQKKSIETMREQHQHFFQKTYDSHLQREKTSLPPTPITAKPTSRRITQKDIEESTPVQVRVKTPKHYDKWYAQFKKHHKEAPPKMHAEKPQRKAYAKG